MRKAKNAEYPPLHLIVDVDGEDKREYVFSQSFIIGREDECDLTIQNSHVSRTHVEVDFRDQCWWVHDLESTNGIFVNGKKVQHAPVLDRDLLVLGKDGPRVQCTYISKQEAQSIKAEQVTDSPKKEKNRVLILSVLVVVLAASGFLFGKNELGKQERFRERALELFSQSRKTNVAIAEVYAGEETDRLARAQQIIELQKTLNNDLESYKGYLIRMGFYADIEDPITQLIYNTASRLSENELTLPIAFVEDVRSCIQKCWLQDQSGSYEAALSSARFANYSSSLLKTLREFGLPQEFFYLPLSISGFDGEKDLLSGFETRAGIWQLTKSSAMSYGLVVEENNERSLLDHVDERYDFSKSTRASAQLLQDIYRQESLASGLLTVALFLQYQKNQAAGKEIEVGTLLADIPDDIDSRNLWYIMERYPYRISEDVYQEVIRVFSAAVIGQDPLVFNLDFSTPTATNMSSNIYRAFR